MKGKYVDLIGKQFNYWFVLARSKNKNSRGVIKWLCRCICGKQKEVTSISLVHGRSKSCGCKIRHTQREDIAGQHFGALTAISFSHTEGENKDKTFWIYKCICGNEITKNKYEVKKSVNKGCIPSCGCLGKSRAGYTQYQSLVNRLFHRYQDHSKNNKREFVLSYDDFYKFILQDCFYCGSSPATEMKANGKIFKYNGLDRIDPALGYSIGNIVTCCKLCNFMKHTLSLDEFLVHVKLIVNHQEKEKQNARYNDTDRIQQSSQIYSTN